VTPALSQSQERLLRHWMFMSQPGAVVPRWCMDCKEIAARILFIFGLRVNHERWTA
jgi:hypothetical protein